MLQALARMSLVVDLRIWNRFQVSGSTLSIPLLMAWRLHPIFRFDTKTIRDAVDVVEIANDLGCHGDLFVRDTQLAESIKMRSFDFCWLEG